MRFVVNECTGPYVARWLIAQGYEVFSIFEQARGMEDEVIIEKLNNENWKLITNDKDFGEKIFRDRKPHKGIILLRLEDERPDNKIAVLKRLISNHSELIKDNFTVASERRIRIVEK